MELNSSHIKSVDTYNTPLLSIIIPVYNTSLYLQECLDSILNQTYRNIEVLIIDDGSTDNSGAICDLYANQDSRVCVVHQTNKGQSACRNMALDMCKGDFITFVDSDDKVNSDVYKSNIGLFEDNPTVDIIQYPYCRLYEDGKIESGIEAEGEIMSVVQKYEDAFIRYKLRSYMCNKIFRKDVWEKLRFSEGYVFEDRALLPEILEKSRSLLYSKYGMYYYRSRKGQTTSMNHSKLFIESRILADLNIVRHAVKSPALYHIALLRYADCLFYCKKGGGVMYSNVVKNLPSLSVVFKAHCALGLKLKCLLIHLCPKVFL